MKECAIKMVIALTPNLPLGNGFLNVASFLLNTLEFPSLSESSISGEDVRGLLIRAKIKWEV